MTNPYQPELKDVHGLQTQLKRQLYLLCGYTQYEVPVLDIAINDTTNKIIELFNKSLATLQRKEEA